MGTYETFDEQKQFACRVIADHARTTAFAIADGILPGNEGRNYVLRKIMRRAIYHGREHLGFEDSFFYKVCDFVVEQMKTAYPELETQREFIGKMVRLEEERFGNTLTVGLRKLDELIIDKLLEENRTIILNYPNEFFAGYLQVSELARLYDTFGLNPDVMYVALTTSGKEANQKYYEGKRQGWQLIDKDNNIFDISEIGEENFRKLIENELKEFQKQSNIGKTQQNVKINPIYKSLEEDSIRSNFHGYDLTKVEDAKVISIVKNDEKVDELNEGEEGLIILDETPFYAEAGGQVGDKGWLVRTAYGNGWLNAGNSKDENANGDVKPSATADGSDKGAQIIVQDTFAPIAGIVLHKSKIKSGSLKVGDKVTAIVDREKRDATRRNHTATHLVHAALKEVLGTHVKQAGSVVAPNYLRFDFTHYQPMTEQEIKDVEDLVNKYILENHSVNTNVMPIDEAKKSGAVALFGEKYGSEVRVLSVADGVFSKELCGGTHVSATGDIGSFKITNDEAIASGVRRIRAITGFDAFERFREDEILIDKSLEALRTQRDQLPSAIEKLQEELKKSRKEVDELKLKIASGAVGTSSNGDETKEIGGIKVIAKAVDDLDKGGMRHLSDNLMSKIKSGVVIIGNKTEEKVSFIVRVSDDLTDKIRAGNIIKEIAPIVGGKGGGKPDMAEGGGTDAGKLDDALQASYEVIEKMVNG